MPQIFIDEKQFEIATFHFLNFKLRKVNDVNDSKSLF